MTGYPALVARDELIPMMISDADITELRDGETITVDAERGIVYGGDIGDQPERP